MKFRVFPVRISWIGRLCKILGKSFLPQKNNHLHVPNTFWNMLLWLLGRSVAFLSEVDVDTQCQFVLGITAGL